jgi:hypothetical protein
VLCLGEAAMGVISVDEHGAVAKWHDTAKVRSEMLE